VLSFPGFLGLNVEPAKTSIIAGIRTLKGRKLLTRRVNALLPTRYEKAGPGVRNPPDEISLSINPDFGAQ
jgi:hypothetical protein